MAAKIIKVQFKMNSHIDAFYTTQEQVPGKNSLKFEHAFPQKAEVMSTKFNPNDKTIACGYSDGFTRIYNIKDGVLSNQINNTPKEHSPITAVHWRPEDVEQNTASIILLLANANGNLYEVNTKTGKEIFHAKEDGNNIMAVDYHPDASAFCSAGKDNIIRIYDDRTRKISHRLEGVKWQKTGHNNRIFAVKYKEDEPNLIASGGWDQNVNIWDVRSNKVQIVLHGPAISGQSIDFQENLVVTGAHRSNNQVQLWDIREAKTIKTYQWEEAKQNSGLVCSCQFVKAQPDLIMAVGGHDLKLFRTEGSDKAAIGLSFFQEENFIYSCDSASNSLKFTFGGKKGVTYNFSSKKMIQ